MTETRSRRIHLIRHADAEPRRSRREPDSERALSVHGHAQASALTALQPAPGVSIHSSPAVRCVDTVKPLAGHLGVAVTVDHRLAEGADPRVVVEWISSDDAVEMVLCGHGDLLPEVLRLLHMRGMTLDGPNACQKGSVWTCRFDAVVPTHASYRPPPQI